MMWQRLMNYGEDKSKYLPSETNVFEKQHKYCLGRNELGIVDDS